MSSTLQNGLIARRGAGIRRMDHKIAITKVAPEAAAAKPVTLLYFLDEVDDPRAEEMALSSIRRLGDRYDPVIFAPLDASLPEIRRSGLKTRRYDGTGGFVKCLFPYLVNEPELVFFSTVFTHALLMILLNLIYRRPNTHVHLIWDAHQPGDYRRHKMLGWCGVRLAVASDALRRRLLDHGVNPRRVTVMAAVLHPPCSAGRDQRRPDAYPETVYPLNR